MMSQDQPKRRNFVKHLIGGSVMATLPITSAFVTPFEVKKDENSVEAPIKFPLWPELPLTGFGHDEIGLPPSIEWYWPQNIGLKALVVICPGGGYQKLAPHEGKDVAEFLNAQGYAAAVVYYTIKPKQYYRPYQDIRRAMLLARERIATTDAKFPLKSSKIFLVGFSAGGHAAGTMARNPDFLRLATQQDRMLETVDTPLLEKFNPVPDGLILGYPVVSMTDFAHQGSIKALLGINDDELNKPVNAELRIGFSHQLHVTEKFPTTFLFHTANDGAVPVKNSLSLAEACIDKGVETEIHIFPKGRHGVGLATDNPILNQWTKLLVSWLDKQIG
jgi:acetyl esterase/lipase